MTRPPIKSTKKLEEAKLKVHEKARMKEPASLWIKDRVAKMLENIDPMEATAILGLTFIIHNTIVTNAELINAVDASYKSVGKTLDIWLKFPITPPGVLY